jgi:creatinine amidohydrolase
MESIFSETMADMNWQEIEDLGNQDIPVLFPLGVIEEHGPHLPLATDIYLSYAICRKIKKEIESLNGKCLIAPPYYWGINYCTGAFPGSFSLKEETLRSVLGDIFENLNQFGFNRIYCVNVHGDPLHTKTILESIRESNKVHHMNIRLLMEQYDLKNYNLTGDEPYILLDEAQYPQYLFPDDNGRLDIHAGAFETAAMEHFFKDLVDTKVTKNLKDYSLNYESIKTWLKGGEATRELVPLGYAGNPSEYEKERLNAETTYSILCEYVARAIMI